MSQMRRLASAYLALNPSLIGADEQKAPVVKLPAAYIVALSAVVLFVMASAAWWAWRFVSLELIAVYAEGFRKAGMAEGQSHPGEPNSPTPKKRTDRALVTAVTSAYFR